VSKRPIFRGALQLRACCLKYMATFATSLCIVTGSSAQQPPPPKMDLGGTYQITDSGAAQYTIPLQVPPGIGAIEPQISLAYSSQSGNGPLGLGWSLAGLSSITRCPQTLAQDGANWTSGIKLTTTDRFCLDGQRLVNVRNPSAVSTTSPGAYGADQTYYATERESFSKIQQVGIVGSASSPSSFKVWTKSGLIMEYGTGAATNARVLAAGTDAARVWALSKVSDVFGNYMTITYKPADTNGGQLYPLRIDYTANDGASPALTSKHSVEFAYDVDPGAIGGTRSDTVVAYIAGSKISTAARLQKITTRSAGNVVQVSTLGYDTNDFGSYLRTVTVCDAVGTKCLPPTKLDWGNTSADPTGSLPDFNGGPWIDPARESTMARCFTGDFTGDGRTDVACYSLQNGDWHVAASTGSGWSTTSTIWPYGPDLAWAENPESPNDRTSVHDRCFALDFNGDGKTDLMCYTSYNTTTWAMFASTGSGWSRSDWSGPYLGASEGSASSRCFTADLNGDGRGDFACWTTSGGTWAVHLSKGTHWESLNWAGPGGMQACGGVLGDFDGDGRADLMCLLNGGSGAWRLYRSTGTNWESLDWNNGPLSPQSDAGYGCLTGDFNADGKTDIACQASPGNWRVGMSTGKGFETLLFGNGPQVAYPLDKQCAAGEVNGDGRTDLMCYTTQAGTWLVSMSTGKAWKNIWWGNMINSERSLSSHCAMGVFKGDGKTGFACNVRGGGSWVVMLPVGDLFGQMKKVTRGVKGTVEFVYDTLPQQFGLRYTPLLVPPVYPLSSVAPALSVVTSSKSGDGLGGVRTTHYRYSGAVADIGAGRGFFGFNWVQRHDEQKGLVSRTTFNQMWPYVGMAALIAKGTSEASWNNLGVTNNQFGCNDFVSASGCTPQAGRRYFAYVSQSESLGVKDLTAMGAVGVGLPGSRAVQTMDEWGNTTGEVLTPLAADGTASGFSTTTSHTYAPVDTVNWRLDRKLKTSVTNVSP
jgi:hypothetical protein